MSTSVIEKKGNDLVYGVNQQFSKVVNYEKVSKKAQLRSVAYITFCQYLQKYYINYKKAADGLLQASKSNKAATKSFIQKLKSFVEDFATALRDISTFQIDSLTEITNSQQDVPRHMTQVMAEKISQYKQAQEQFRQKDALLEENRKELKGFITVLKKQATIPYIYYDIKYMQQKHRQFLSLEEKIKKLDDDMEKVLEKIKMNSEEFNKYINAYKKKMRNFKHETLQKTINTSKTSKECLTELLVYLSECIFAHYNQYYGNGMDVGESKSFLAGLDREISIQMLRKKESDHFKVATYEGDLQKQIISLRQDYLLTIDELLQLVMGLIQNFKIIRDPIAIHQNSKQEFYANATALYESNQSPSTPVTQSMDLYYDFTMRVTSLIVKFQGCQNELQTLKKNATKHVDITLSIIKSNLRGTDKYIINRYSEQKMQLTELEQQLSSQLIKNVIASVFQSFKDTFTQLNNFFGQKFYRKKKMDLEDSMDLSYVEESRIFKLENVPAKNERWMWENWKDVDSFRYSNSLVLLENVHSFFDKMNLDNECGKYIEKYQCSLESKENRQIKGQLQVTEKELIFKNAGSSQNAMVVVVPLSHIKEDIEIKTRFIDEFMHITTKAGKLHFKKFADIVETKNFIQQRMSDGVGNQPEEVPTRQAVVLSQEQLDFIAQRKEKIKPELKSLDGFEKYGETQFKDVGIDEVYEQIYSDLPVKVQGKDYGSFLEYVMTKLKNFEYSTQKYDSPGPKFYTLNQQVSFLNCKLFSTRNNKYMHLLPAIPFMPKAAQVNQQARVYWISHQQFDYLIHNQTSGAPSSDTFYVQLLHKVRKVSDSVIKVEIYGIVVFVKDSSLKGIVKSKSTQEMKSGVGDTIQLYNKRINNYKRLKSGPKGGDGIAVAAELEQEQEDDQQKQTAGQLNKVKSQKNMLIIVVAVILVFNILLKIIGF